VDAAQPKSPLAEMGAGNSKRLPFQVLTKLTSNLEEPELARARQ
jgi:hypothetical protein